jgi:hypothetical protein
MKAYGGVDVQIHIFLISTLTEGEWSASRPGRSTSGAISSSTHWIRGWVDTRAGLYDVEKRKFLTVSGLEFRPLDRPARSQSLYQLKMNLRLRRVEARSSKVHKAPQVLRTCVNK